MRGAEEWLARLQETNVSDKYIKEFYADDQYASHIENTLFSMSDPSALNTLCAQLLTLFRSGRELLRNYATQFLPWLTFAYLRALNDSSENEDVLPLFESCIITVYNVCSLSNVGKNTKAHTPTNKLYTCHSCSIFHDHLLCGESTHCYTTDSLDKSSHSTSTTTISYICATNRFKVLARLIVFYNQRICYMSAFSRDTYCRAAEGIPNLRRLSIDSQLLSALLEGLHAINFADAGAWASYARRAATRIARRAELELYADASLMAHSVLSDMSHSCDTNDSDTMDDAGDVRHQQHVSATMGDGVTLRHAVAAPDGSAPRLGATLAGGGDGVGRSARSSMLRLSSGANRAAAKKLPEDIQVAAVGGAQDSQQTKAT